MNQTSDLLVSMSESIYQTLVETHQHHPDWFQNKFKSYSWQNPEFKDKFITRLVEKFSPTEEWDTVILKLIALLTNIFLPIFFKSQLFTRLISKLNQLSSSHQNSSPLSDEGLAVLLLDAENLSLEEKIERLLERLSSYPLKVKLAVANWRSLGKKDEELKQRGYVLIHVPSGKNNADLEMIALGDSVFLHSCLVKEVFVCSCDKDLDPLIKRLIQNDLIVHRVSRKADEIVVVDPKTQKIHKYSISSLPDIPSLQDFIPLLKKIILEEQKKQEKQWLLLSEVSKVFKEKTGLHISQIVNYLLPGKRARDIFIEFKEDFVIHQIGEKSELYVTVFEKEKSSVSPVESAKISEVFQVLSSQELLKIAVVGIVKVLSEQSKQEYIPIANVASEFNKQYNLPITKAIKTFQLGNKLITFLKSCEQLKLKQKQKLYQVALK
ncbi:NYN domain-containing protein [Gloeothece verrucosa]|uniref:NYN domain-containing protein n=1 Tax=Gloeothece verrucosa (strain PCC 7822) TaxID=497965 RepID=E0UEA4_GLOV7|nr:NYN domain-containing protein [Gloeothece verrucosa]ADN14229.1 conserved hypothetical protein [Gloeothece verrucosa PCC 7822]